MSDSDNSNSINYYHYNTSNHIDESSIPSIHKIRSLYESKIKNDQDDSILKKKKPKTIVNSSLSRQSSVSKESEAKNKPKKSGKNKIKYEYIDKNENNDKKFEGDLVYNYDMDTEEENYLNNKQNFKRKFEDSEEQSNNDLEENQYVEDKEKKLRLKYYNENEIPEQEISEDNEHYSENEENSHVVYYDDEDELNYSLLNEDETGEHEIIDYNQDHSMEQPMSSDGPIDDPHWSLIYEEKIKKENNGNKYERFPSTSSKGSEVRKNSQVTSNKKLKLNAENSEGDEVYAQGSKEPEEETETMIINKVNKPKIIKKTKSETVDTLSEPVKSTPSKIKQFFFNSNAHPDVKKDQPSSTPTPKHNLSVSSSSSKSSENTFDSSSNTPIPQEEEKGFLGFKKLGRKSSKSEDSGGKSEESNVTTAGKILSSPSKIASFFHKSSSKKDKRKEEEHSPTLLDQVNTSSPTSAPVPGQETTAQDPEPVKRVPKRKRSSSVDESDAELEKQKVKKIRLLQEEIKTIQQSIELKQQELRLQYDNLIKTRNSLLDPNVEGVSDFMPPPSNLDFNPLPPIYPSTGGGRPSSASTFSRASYYDYPFEIRSSLGDPEFPNSSYASSDFRRFSQQRFSNPSSSKVNMNDPSGRYSTTGNSMYSSFNPGAEDPSSFYTNYSTFDPPSKFGMNPNRPSAAGSTASVNPSRFSNASYNTSSASYYPKYDPNLSSPNQSKGSMFSFLRKRRNPSSEGMYPPSMIPSPTSFDQGQNPNMSSSDYKRNSFGSSGAGAGGMDVSLTKPFYYYFIPLTRRKVKVRVDPLLRNAINYAKAAGNFECLKYLCEFEKIPNKYVDLRSIEEAAAHNDIDELKFLLKHSWFYDLKRYFILLFKIVFLIAIFLLILYYFNGFNETLIAFFVTYVVICITYNWIYRDK